MRIYRRKVLQNSRLTAKIASAPAGAAEGEDCKTILRLFKPQSLWRPSARRPHRFQRLHAEALIHSGVCG
jgi:hypothetical protein